MSSPKALSFSLTEGTIDLLRAVSLADDRSMSAEIRHMIRDRAYRILESPNVTEASKARIRDILATEEFSVAEVPDVVEV